VDLEAIRHNAGQLKPSSAELLAVVKANGYGHGDVAVARAALEGGATWIGVALVEEGARLREAGIDAPILMLSQFPPGSERDALGIGLTPTVYTDEGATAVARAAATLRAEGLTDGPCRVHVKVDTGMHRVGVFPPENLIAFCERARDEGLEVDGLWTHFARSEDSADTTKQQLDLFVSLTTALGEVGITPRYRHAANSGATVLYPETHLDIVRPGLSLYGLPPLPAVAAHLDLRPALSWRSAVSFVKHLPAGEAVSYGLQYRLAKDAWIATVPVGYADGYSRRMSGRAHVLIGGKRYPVAGSITMDQLLVDCGDDRIEPGSEVALIGRQGEGEITAQDLADWSGTVTYEVLCAISERVPREYLHS